jgi:hypothetical protein
MAEWFKAAVLKTVVGLHLTGGSNPSLSVSRETDWEDGSPRRNQRQPRWFLDVQAND